MYAKYRDVAAFYIVYVREAHPADGKRPKEIPDGPKVLEAKTIDQRAETATQCVRNLKLDIPCLLDDMDNSTSEAYAGHPDRLYIVGADGRIALAGERGPKGFKPEVVRQWLEKAFPNM